MKFVIVGFGRVGIRTARILSSENHEVTVIDSDPEKVERASEEGFTALQGSGDDESLLEEAGIETADAIAALTDDLNVNFSACMIGKHHGARTVMRIDADYREEIYEAYASEVDEVVYPERLGAAGAKTALLGGDFNVLADLTERLSVATIDVPDGADVVSKRVVEVELPGDARIYAHGRRNEPMSIPLPDTTIEAGDTVAVTTDPDSLEAIRATLGA
ncbi:potassium channel family protein [Halapricum desulfuricans]|uniref:TrkA, K+ transport system, NAD-binding component n=1 Tax=Halapricum desulfuricans TaxID=2841257 RepID=A0A897NJ71_9EURY|nr:TrkA family potassium uptake protein [Halapricum desulfuricans]QSG10336.1 TrkA, K+ transport system, NAD-binding component [Halapricum desulfuricans]